MKSSTIKLIVWSVIAALLTALLIALLIRPSLLSGVRWQLPGVSALQYDNASLYTAGNGSVGGIHSIDIEWIDGRVEFVEGTGSEISFTETASQKLTERNALHWFNDNGTLRIQYAAAGVAQQTNAGKVLTVTLPAGAEYRSIDVDTVSADMTLCALQCGDTNLESVSGKISVAGLTGKEAGFSSISGKITAAALQVTDLDCETTSGAMELVCSAAPRRIDTESVSGDVQITLPADTGFTADFSTVSGDFSSTIPAIMQDDKYMAGDGSMELDCETVSGGLWIIAD